MGRTDVASRVVAATPETVFAALTDPEALTAWLPPDGLTGRFEHFDARPGGGDFVSDDPANAGTMTRTWSVAAVEGGTRVEFRADAVPAGISAADHAAALASSLEHLARYVA